MRKSFVKDIRSVVVKVGTSVLTERGRFDKKIIQKLASQIAVFLKKRVQVSIVSSGAIGAGMTILKEKARPKTMEGLQAAAAIGQRYLMQCYEEAFSKHGLSTAQVLLTWEDLAHKSRFMNAKRTLHEIHRRGLIPIINENDTVATEEIRFGDNDRLSALLAMLIEADVLVILSDTNGLYAGEGRREANRLKIVEEVGESIFGHVKDTRTHFTVGGMRSKLKAIGACAGAGIPVFLADGRMRGILSRIFQGEDIGTFFLPRRQGKNAKRSWIFYFQNHIRQRRQDG